MEELDCCILILHITTVSCLVSIQSEDRSGRIRYEKVMELETLKEQQIRGKKAILQQYEAYAYQIAYYILEDEPLAAEAATQALLELIQDEVFCENADQLQRQKMRKTTMKKCLLVKAAALSS